MTELSRNLLAAAREGLAPDAAIAARVRARVAASVAGTAAVATIATPAKASAAIATKLAIGALVIGVVVATVVIATRASQPGAESPRFAAASVELDEPHSAVQVAVAEPAAAAQLPALREPAVAAPREGRSQTTARAPIVIPASPEPMTLSREVQLIDRAMLLVRNDAATAALGVIATYDRETRGEGQLAEDAAAIDIEARCRLRQDVAARLAAFDRTWPSSAQRSRLQTACFAKSR